MSNLPGENPLTSDEIRDAYEANAVFEDTIKILETDKAKNLEDIRDRIRAGVIPTDVEFIAAALLSGSSRERLAHLKKINTKVIVNRGAAVAWVTSDEVITTRRFAGPHDYETHWYLNVGTLPQGASLALNEFGRAYIPVTNALTSSLRCTLDPGDGGDKPTWHHSRIANGTTFAYESDGFELPLYESPDYGVFFGDEIQTSLPQLSEISHFARFLTSPGPSPDTKP